MPDALATYGDVEDVWRPLSVDERTQATNLIQKVTALLPGWLVKRIEDGAVNPVAVATLIAVAVKDYMVNREGASSFSESAGPFSESVTYSGAALASRGSFSFRDDLLRKLRGQPHPSMGSIRVRPSLAPRPVGRYGPPVTPREAADAQYTWSDDT